MPYMDMQVLKDIIINTVKHINTNSGYVYSAGIIINDINHFKVRLSSLLVDIPVDRELKRFKNLFVGDSCDYDLLFEFFEFYEYGPLLFSPYYSYDGRHNSYLLDKLLENIKYYEVINQITSE